MTISQLAAFLLVLVAGVAGFDRAYAAMSVESLDARGITFGANGTSPTTERMRITTSGKVGISTTVPIAKLDVIGTISASDVIQIGSGTACVTGTAGAVRYNASSNTLDYCNGASWTSTGPSSTSPVSFSVNRNGTNQSVSANTVTLLAWTNVAYDTNNNFNTGTGKFTPTIPGKYIFHVHVRCDSTTNACQANIWKNGAGVATNQTAGSGSLYAQSVAILDMNGSTDYVQAYVYNGGGTVINGATTSTFFEGSMLGPQSGGSGGSGVSGGTANYGAIFADATSLITDSAIYVDTTNHRLGVGTNAPGYPLDVNGYVGAVNFYQTSDRRLKINITPIADGLNVINRLRPVTFDWKKDNRPSAGLIAQEVEPILPHAIVSTTEGTYSLDYIQTVPYLIRSVQQLQSENGKLRRRLEVLERGTHQF